MEAVSYLMRWGWNCFGRIAIADAGRSGEVGMSGNRYDGSELFG